LIPDRHLVREYDHRPENAASRGYWAATANMALRLTAHPSARRTFSSWPCERRRPPSPPAGRTQRSRWTRRQGRRRRHEQPRGPPRRPERHHGRRRARPPHLRLHSAQAASGASFGFTYPALPGSPHRPDPPPRRGPAPLLGPPANGSDHLPAAAVISW
jgi:hypothetical protein